MPSAVNTHQQNKSRSMLPNHWACNEQKAEAGRMGNEAHQQEVEHEGSVSELPVVQMTAGLPRCWGPKDP